MNVYGAYRIVFVAEALEQCKIRSIGMEKKTPEGQKNVAEWLGKVDSELKYLGLEMTRVYAKRIQGTIAECVEKNTLVDELIILTQRFRDELQGIQFFYIPPDKLRSYNKTDLFGDEFKTKFPLANSEIIEAGNCFALDRFTSCVFHLMKAMEIALRVLFVSLGMPPRIWSTTKWTQISKRIEGKIERNNKTLAADPVWQQDRAFYENASAFVAAVRAPMRNATMHVGNAYDEPGADNVFGAVKSFMRHIATKLKE